ncbi:MAG: hypothetical protein HOH36_14900 [Acidimicrobiaceae bacterium]|jgi:tight adherence protein B|nr:hypothetical protein [Acidimicrobiaceae bacterium]
MVMAVALVAVAVFAFPDMRVPSRGLTAPLTARRWDLPAWIGRRRYIRARAHRGLVGDLPDVLEMIARSLRGGTNLRGALADAMKHDSPAAHSLRPVMLRINAGDRLGEALDAWASRIDDPAADLVRAVLRLGDETGTAVASSLEQAATSLRDRAALTAEIQALSSQARLSSMVIGFAPLAFLAVSAIVDPASAAVLVTTRFGLACLALGLGLDVIGVRWMRRIGAGVAQ